MHEGTDPVFSVTERLATGIDGLDELLGSGLPVGEMFAVQGNPGTGKTTFGLQFALAGVAAGETVLYFAMSETVREIHRIAASHGWSLDGVHLHRLSSGDLLDENSQQTMLHPAEVELPETAIKMVEVVEQIRPHRIVIDSMSELRMLARDSRWYRRQILTLKEHFAEKRCTTLVLDEQREDNLDHDIQSIASGVIDLHRECSDYGPARRRLTIMKMRGVAFDDGRHDMSLATGGLRVFPRLVAGEHAFNFDRDLLSTDIPELDRLLGGGLDRGSSVLLIGPTGTGKSTLAIHALVAAASRGERSVLFVFDERVPALLQRCRGLGIELEPFLQTEMIHVQQVDAAELTPGEFSHGCRQYVEAGIQWVMIDSLNGYFYAMPNDRYLPLHFNELRNYLNHYGVTVLATSAQHGLIGSNIRVPADVSFLADTVLLLRHFEFAGSVRQAVSVHKRRNGPHERLIREMTLSDQGIQIGEPLEEFQGVLTGVPQFVGQQLK